jgi:hypothetical protein
MVRVAGVSVEGGQEYVQEARRECTGEDRWFKAKSSLQRANIFVFLLAWPPFYVNPCMTKSAKRRVEDQGNRCLKL